MREESPEILGAKVKIVPEQTLIDKLIESITEVRADNNVLWMGLLKLAFRHAPTEADVILKKIVKNDSVIRDLCAKISKTSETKPKATRWRKTK